MSTITRKELEHRYDGASHEWTRKVERMGFARAYRNLLERTLREHGLRDGTRVLDAGIGTGLFTSAFAAAAASVGGVETPIAYHGLDISAAMLKEARLELYEAGINLHTRQGSVDRLPYGDNSFDVIITAHVIEHLDHPEEALLEFCRVLRPGGIVVIVSTQSGLWGRKIARDWGVDLLSPESLLYTSLVAGLTGFHHVPFGGIGLPHFASFAAVARKSLTAPTEPVPALRPGRQQAPCLVAAQTCA